MLIVAYKVFVERFRRIAAITVAGVGAIVLIGWIGDVATLKSVLPGLATMKANTACGFIAMGAALWLFEADSRARRLIAGSLVCAVIALGALSLSETVFAIDFGIDQLLLRDPARTAGPLLKAGRMSPATALNFCLIGIAVLARPPGAGRTAPSWARWAVLPAGLISMVAVVGYAYDSQQLYSLAPFSSMAVHTALMFALLCLANLGADPTRGIVGIAISDTAGGIACRRLLLTIPIGLFVFGWLRLQGQEAGLYGTNLGLSIMIAASISVSVLVICLTVASLHDLDLRRVRAEAALIDANSSLEARVLARTAELKEREILLQEIHHRVKNNLQVICSLINMQVRLLDSSADRAALLACRSRIQTMSEIQDLLYQATDYAQIPFAKYARQLATRVLSAANAPSARIVAEFHCEELSLRVDKAIPCALILNELLSNALQHAFPQDAAGTVVVEFRRSAGDEILLAVNDDGVGMGADVDPRQSTSLGLRLVMGLLQQLHGRIEIGRGSGTRCRCTFPAEAGM